MRTNFSRLRGLKSSGNSPHPIYCRCKWILRVWILLIDIAVFFGDDKLAGLQQEQIQSVYYHPHRSWGKVIFSQASVILSTVGSAWSQGGLFLGGAWSGGSAPRRGLLQGRSAPGGCLVETPPGRLLLRAVRILLECILVFWLRTCGLYFTFRICSDLLDEVRLFAPNLKHEVRIYLIYKTY